MGGAWVCSSLISISNGGEVYLFNENSELLRGDPLLNSEAKWNYKNGISELGKRIAACSGVKIIKETRVISLEEISNGEWELTSADGKNLGVYDAVLFTPPAPQVIELISDSMISSELSESLMELLRESEYHCQFPHFFHKELLHH